MIPKDIVTNVSIITILAFTVGYFVFFITKDIEWVVFNFYVFTAMLISLILLKYSQYVKFITVSVLFMFLAVFFLFFKIDINYTLEKADNSIFVENLRKSIPNTKAFFWLLFFISFITLITIIMTNKMSYLMDLKEPPKGEIGYDGEQGKIGFTPVLSSNREIIYSNLIFGFNNKIQQIDENKALNNIFIKEQLRNICDSVELKKEILEITNSDSYKKLYHDDNTAIQRITNKLLIDCTSWVNRFLLYNKGLYFLNNPFLNMSDWELLYINKDRENNLDKDYNVEMIKVSPRWEWSIKCDN